MASLKIATWNIRGIKSLSLRQAKIEMLLNTTFDIIFIQEMRLNTIDDVEDVYKLWSKGKSVISIGEDTADGVGILFKNQQVEIVRTREIVPGRLLMIDCFYNHQKLRLINVYTAQNTHKKCKVLRKIRELLNVSFNVILCGDFNTITDERDRIGKGSFRNTIEGKILKQISEEYNLTDTFRALHPFDYGFTRSDPKVKTRIDRIYTSPNIKIISYKTIFKDCSDHMIVYSNVCIGSLEKKGFWKLNTQCLKNPEIISELKQEVSRIKQLKVLSKSNVELWEIFKQRIRTFLKNQM